MTVHSEEINITSRVLWFMARLIHLLAAGTAFSFFMAMFKAVPDPSLLGWAAYMLAMFSAIWVWHAAEKM
jgi:hypothetical protein